MLGRRFCAMSAAVLALVSGLTLAAAPPATALGSVLYVSATGVDAPRTCTAPASPCATVTYALSQATQGATINVTGTIHDRITVGSANAGVTITGVAAPAGAPAVIDGSGAGQVVVAAADVHLDHLTIRNGRYLANVDQGQGGGGLLVNPDVTAELTATVVTGSTSSRSGGGIFSRGTLVVTDSTISDNVALNDGSGGGIQLQAGSAQIVGSSITGNTATVGGGIGVGDSGQGASAQLDLRASTVSGNHAVDQQGSASTNEGGGVNVESNSTMVARSSTFTGNHSDFTGGGLSARFSDVTLIGSTVSANASSAADGISSQFATVRMLGSIVAGNGTSDCAENNGTWVVAHSLVGGECGTGTGAIIGADPRLGDLADNGGPTRTLALSADSLAANAIPVGTVVGAETLCGRTDQTGAAAPVASAAGCSMGAVEATGRITARTFHVAAGGSNGTSDCLVAASPCATVSYAVGRAEALTPVGADVTIRVSGTINDRVTIEGDPRRYTITGAGAAAPAVIDGQSGGLVVDASFSDVTLDHLTIRNGHTSNFGGGILFTQGLLTLSSVTVTANSADFQGGGVWVTDGDVVIERSTISGNTAGPCVGCPNAVQGGGGIFVGSASTLTVVDSTISGNQATNLLFGAGAGILSVVPITVTSSTITGNVATRWGGGIRTAGGTITTSTLTGNSAGVTGGGLDATPGTTTITRSTIAGNTATSSGGGVQASRGTVNVAGTIVSANTGGNCAAQIDSSDDGIFSQGRNLDSAATCAFTGTGDLSNTAAGLGALASNGGPTQTMLPAAGSAAVGKIPTGSALCPRTDQRGKPGPVAGQTQCTIGAAEPGAPTAPSFSTPAARAATDGTRFTFPVTVSSPVTTTIEVSPSSTLPAGVTFTDDGGGQGTLSGYASAGTYSFGLIAANGVAPNATQTITLTVAKRAQATIAVTSLTGANGTPLPLTISGSSGTGALTFTVTNGTATGCAILASPPRLTTTSMGTCTVTATRAADAHFLARSSPPANVTIGKATQAALTLTSVSGTFATPVSLTTSGGSGTGAVTYTAVNGTATGCAVSGATLTSTSAGTCTVTATKATDANFAATSSPPTTVTLAKANQAVLTVTSTSSRLFTPLGLTTSGGSGTGVVTYTVANGTATGCVAPNDFLSASTVGTCIVTATKAGDGGYNPRTSAATTVTIDKERQAELTVDSTSGTFGLQLTLIATGGTTNGSISYNVVNGTASGCTISAGNKLNVTSGGTCIVTATRAGNTQYDAVSSAPTTVTFARSTQGNVLQVTSTFGTFGTPLTLTTVGGNGTGAVTFAVTPGTAAGCAVAGDQLTTTTAGSCNVVATKAADNSYEAQSSATTLVVIDKANQPTITVTSTSGTFGTPLPITFSGGAGTGSVSFAVQGGTASGCQISGGSLSSTTAGTCRVTVTKGQDPSYLPAQSALTTITFAKLNQDTLVLTSTSGTVGTPLTLTTSGGSGTGFVTYTAVNGTATGCTINGATLTVTSAGTCSVRAIKNGDVNYNQKRSNLTTVTFSGSAQASLLVSSTSGTFGTPLTLTTSGGSGTGAVTYAVANGTATGCAVSGSTLTTTSAGTCTVTATKAGDGTFGATSSAPTAVTLAKATQATLAVTSTSGTYPDAVILTTTGGSGTGAVTFTAVNGTATGCAVSGSLLLSTSAGTCTVTATKAGDANFVPRSSAATTVTFAKGTQVPLTVTSTSGTFGTALPLTTSGGSGTGAVTFGVVNGTATGCAVSGATLTSTSAGTCTVTATKAGDANYNQRSSSATTVTVGKANQAALVVTTLNGNVGSPLPLTTSGGSGTGALTFTVTNGTAAGCAVNGATLTATSAGTCVVTASKAGDGNFNATSSVATSVSFKAAQATLTITSTSGPAGSPLALATTGGSGTGSVSYAVVNGTATGCAIGGTTLSAATAGTCTLTATKAGDANFAPTSSAPTTITFTKLAQATLTVRPASGTVGTPVALATSGGSGTGAVTFVAADGTATGCAVSGSALTATTAGTCSVTASKAGDATFDPTSSVAATITFVAPTGGTYGPLVPARLLDTREPGQGPCVAGTRELVVTGVGGVPAGAGAVALNVTVISPSGGGFLTVFPTGATRPTASNLNYVAGDVVPNMVIAKVGNGGRVSIFTNAGCPHVAVDVVGWFAAGDPGPGGYGPLVPARLLDTREPGQGPCVAGTRELVVTGVGGVPAGAGAVALNVTVISPSGGGVLTVFPTGATRPTASNLNYVAGQVVPNMVIAKVGNGGRVSIFTNAGCPHVAVDVVGWFAAGDPAPGGYGPLVPARLLDTREPGQGPCIAGTRDLQVTGVGGVPAGAAAVALNVTVVGPTGPGFVTVFPAGATRPTASNLNYVAGQVVPNMVIAKVGTNGRVSIFTNAGCPNVVVDVVGWYAGP